MNNCKSKDKFITAEAASKAALRTQGAIDKFLNITNLSLFRRLNTLWSNDAKERFDIKERLFTEDQIGDKIKAVPNTLAFKQIDNAKGIFYQTTPQVKEGVDFVFEQNPELASIGSPEQYSAYLETIFPDSKVKDILYHGTTSKNKFDKFDSELNNFGGYYFTLNKSVARSYGSAGVIAVVINSTNPLNIVDTSPDMPNHTKVTYEPFKDNNYDYVSYRTDFEGDRTYHESVVRDSEQIHILGSKQDIEGFKQWNNRRQQINELFESDKSLANAVYEALGFKSKPDVILPIGTSGSGKSTFIKTLPKENLVVIEPDAMRVEFTGDMNNKSKDKEIYEEAANRAIKAIKGEPALKYGYARLYRAENEKGVDSPLPNWVKENEKVKESIEATGRWFYKTYEEAKYHSDIFGGDISYVDIPINELEKYNARENKFAGGYGRDGNEYFVSKEIANNRKELILNPKQVVFDTTNLTKEKRLPFIEAIKKAIPNANIQYKLMELNPELAKQRIKAQLARGENRAAVSDETIDRHAASYKQMLEDIKNEPISNYEVTPEQKQQAIQIYAQYLETGKRDIEGFKEFIRKGQFRQKKEIKQSVASEETVNKVKEACKKMGISIESLVEYAKLNPSVDTKTVNGVADLVKGVIAVAHGMEKEALTEEMVHIATAILEQTNPKLITELISKIDRFKIYKEVLKAYKNNKAYQLSNGKPDIRKIKKEAVDKLIAEAIVNSELNEEDFPELMQETNRNIVQRWWEIIKDYIKGIYRKTNINIFQQVGQQIIKGEVGGTVEHIINKDVFFQINEDAAKRVKDIYNIYVDRDSRLKLNPETPTDKRHYTFDGERVAKTVTEKAKEQSNFPKREGIAAEIDEMKKNWGLEGHRFIENYISTNMIDKDGFALSTPLRNTIDSPLSEKQQDIIKAFVHELIGSYKPGTRFLIERKVVNERVKGLLASTVDFIAIEPQESGNVKVDMLDWKFTDINKNREEDIPWYKETEWKTQMGEYSKIAYNYGVKPSELRKARMIPFVMNYNVSQKTNKSLSVIPTSIEIGKLDNVKETNMYLLPVPIDTESTGDEKVDELLKALRTQYQKIYNKFVLTVAEKTAKHIELGEIRKAIRTLQLQKNFEPLYDVGKTFLNNAKKVINSFEGIDYAKLSREEIEKKLNDLIEYEKSAEKYITIHSVYKSTLDAESITPKEQILLKNFRNMSGAFEEMLNKIKQLQSEYAVYLGMAYGITSEETKLTVLEAEKTIENFSKTFLESSKLPAKILKLATNMILKAQNLVDIRVANKIRDFQSILLPLEKEARAIGKTAFDLIGTIDERGLHLIKKVDSKFWSDIKQAIENGDKEFLLKNINIDIYNELAQDAINKSIELFNSTVFSSDEQENIMIRESKIRALKDSLDINRKTFDGYRDARFRYILNKALIIEGHYSKEYLNMSDNARKVWEFFTELNDKAKQMGYIKKQGSSFFPLIEATVLDKFSNTSNFGGELKEFLRDFYTATDINETSKYSKIDPETGQLRKSIPKYFTKTNKSISQLSTDLSKVGPMWIQAVYEYENARNLENTLQTLYAVEASKGSLMVDENRKIITEAGKVKINKAENKNADILKTIIEDYLYGLTEDMASLGNIQLTTITEKFVKDKEKQVQKALSTKKLINNMDVLVRTLGVGLKPLIALANDIGFQFQAFISAGDFYKFSTFKKNHIKILTGIGLTTEEKGLIHLISPLNEDVAKEGQREISKKMSLKSFLGSWSFTDVMMITNSFPERRLQYANAMSFNENSMVVNGKIVNIRQYLKKQDREQKYNISEEERKELERTFESRVQQLKEEKSLVKIVVIEDNKITIPGVSDEELANYRMQVIEYNRTLNGQMSNENKAGYRRDTILRSFMMFKTWIPKLLTSRMIDIHKNIELDEWEYGRMRVFFKTWAELGFRNIFKMREIIKGSDEGLKLISKMLEAKRIEYFQKTGKQLEITEEEFYDLIRKELSEEMKELGLLFSTMAMLVAARAAEPPEDATDYEKNHYKFLAKGLNKISDEISFYYNPLSFSGMTQGNIIPSLSLLVKAGRAIDALGKEVTGYIIDDEEMINESYPIKYFLNIIPGAAQFNSEILPIIDPELAKELGIRVSKQSRIR